MPKIKYAAEPEGAADRDRRGQRQVAPPLRGRQSPLPERREATYRQGKPPRTRGMPLARNCRPPPRQSPTRRFTMTTLTYSEQRRKALFKAARELRTVAGSVLDDVTLDAELQSIATLRWAKDLAYTIAKQANTLETLGYEVGTYLSPREDGVQHRSRRKYSASVDGFQKRVLDSAGVTQLNAINAHGHDYN